MKTLWTPWRMEHVQAAASDPGTCLFEPPGSAPWSRRELLLYRDSRALCLLNRFPYANGHLLIAPTRHVACLTDLHAGELQPLMQLVQAAAAIVSENLNPDGMNIGLNIGRVAGAGIDDHLHFHLVPRWRDDHNFMTVIAEIRAIPEHIENTFDRLLPPFQNLIDRQPQDPGPDR